MSCTDPRAWDARFGPRSKKLRSRKTPKAGLKPGMLQSASCSAVSARAEVGGQWLKHLQTASSVPLWLNFAALTCCCRKSFPPLRKTMNRSDGGPHHHADYSNVLLLCIPSRSFPQSPGGKEFCHANAPETTSCTHSGRYLPFPFPP